MPTPITVSPWTGCRAAQRPAGSGTAGDGTEAPLVDGGMSRL
jgi:hypothetical protein